MFNFKNSNSGKIRVKLLATLLVLTLTFANFALVGSYIGEAIAVEIDLLNQTTEIQSSNVEFDVYLEKTANTVVREKVLDISQETVIYVVVNVKNAGCLENPVIELTNTNFKFKNIPEVTSVKLADSIQAGNETQPLEIPIVVKDDESFNLSLLNMQSQIKLTGKYIDDNGNSTEIDTTKTVKIEWTANELINDDIDLTQEIITNKIYNIDGENKRIVQLLVKTQVKDNKAPVKSSILEISNPEIGANPTDVKVTALGTEATNGKTLWSSTEEDGKTIISVLNNAEENIVSWKKNAQDIFIITYVYDGNVEIPTFVSNVKNIVEVYGRTQIEGNLITALEKTNELKLQTEEELNGIADIGNIVTVQNSVTENIFKGKMYLGQDTNYQTTSNIYVSYSNIIDELLFTEQTEEIAEGVSTYFKTTKINKADAIKVLGEEGVISIFNAEDMSTPIETINLATKEIEGDYYIVSYPDDVRKIAIEMSPAQLEEITEINSLASSEGIIEIINEKTIKVTDTEVVAGLTQLKSNVSVQVLDKRNDNGNVTSEQLEMATNASVANLVEPKTTFDISFDKTSLSTQIEDNLKITTELIAKDESNKLFKGTTENPIIINIELPQDIVNAEIVENGIASAFYNTGLSLVSAQIETSESGNKVLVIKVEGEQKEYSANSSIITAELKIKTNAFIADKSVVISATCINDGETAQSTENISLLSKVGLITKNKLTIGEDSIEEINKNNIGADISENTNANISTAILNNFGENVSNINIVGNLPEGVTLTSAILSNTEGVEIYYSEEQNAVVNSNSWTNQVTDYSKMKSFKVSLKEFTKGTLIDLNYNININIENIENDTNLTNMLNVNYEINEQSKEEQITVTFNVIKEEQQLKEIEEVVTQEEIAKITMVQKTTTNQLHEDQILTYQIKVQNISTEALSSVILDYAIPEGTVETALTYAQGAEITFTDNEGSTNKTWEIESIAPNETIIKEITLKIKGGTTQIVNNASLKDSENNIIAQFTSAPVEVSKGDLTVRLSRRANVEIDLTTGNEIIYAVLVTNNTDSVMNNLNITSKVPEFTSWVENSEYNINWEYNETTKVISYNINALNPGETKDIRFVVEVGNIDNNSSKASIENTAVVTTSSGETYETNIYTSNVLVPKFDIHMTAEHNEQLNEGDAVKYIITVTNTGTRSSAVYVKDVLPEEIQFRKIEYYINEIKKFEDESIRKEVIVNYSVEVGETLTIIIEGVTYDLEDDVATKQISNVAKLSLGNEEYLESETIVNTIINDLPENPGNPSNPENPDNPIDPEIPSGEGKYSISGLVWIDKDKNGIRDNEEKNIQALKVILLNKDGEQLAEEITSLTGKYEFNNIVPGEYIIAFDYDKDNYAVTKYQVQNTNIDTNSDVISKQINLNNENIIVGITDIINVQDKNITNIDMGLVEKPKFDLSLNKYISKVVVTNKEGTKTYEYEDTELAKVEIGAKYIEGTVLLVEYEIEVENNGDINGYVTDIVDYMPKELEFNSEMNTEWYLGRDNYLHYMPLDPQIIEPGKTERIKLVLTKTLKSNSTGTIENIAEIAEGVNLEAMADIDSTPNNKKDGEDDIAKASLIVSIRTGGPIMYITIVIAIMSIMGLGIYIINKKVLRVKI